MACYEQGRTQGVVGVNPSLSSIFYKNFITCARRLFSHTFCLLICRLNANTMQISRNIVSGPKSNNYALVGIRAIVCVQIPPNHFLQTLLPRRTRVHSTIVHFIRNNCVHFVGFGWSAQALTALAPWPFFCCMIERDRAICGVLGSIHRYIGDSRTDSRYS